MTPECREPTSCASCASTSSAACEDGQTGRNGGDRWRPQHAPRSRATPAPGACWHEDWKPIFLPSPLGGEGSGVRGLRRIYPLSSPPLPRGRGGKSALIPIPSPPKVDGQGKQVVDTPRTRRVSPAASLPRRPGGKDLIMHRLFAYLAGPLAVVFALSVGGCRAFKDGPAPAPKDPSVQQTRTTTPVHLPG